MKPAAAKTEEETPKKQYSESFGYIQISLATQHVCITYTGEDNRKHNLFNVAAKRAASCGLNHHDICKKIFEKAKGPNLSSDELLAMRDAMFLARSLDYDGILKACPKTDEVDAKAEDASP